MELGLNLPQWSEHCSRRVLRAIVTRAEAVGFASLWVGEHLLWPHRSSTSAPHRAPAYEGEVVQPSTSHHSALAPLETLAFAAALTERVRLGTSVLVTGYHRPVELAKRLATLDVVSDGRVVAGLGIGWSREEYDVSETPWARRGERFEAFVLAMTACWGADPVSHDGPHYEIPRSDILPKPVQARVPLYFGLWSEAGLERTARMAQGWTATWNRHSLDECVDSMERIRTRAAELDRPRPVFNLRGRNAATIDESRRDRDLALAAGVDEFVVELGRMPGLDSETDWLRLADRLEAVVA